MLQMLCLWVLQAAMNTIFMWQIHIKMKRTAVIAFYQHFVYLTKIVFIILFSLFYIFSRIIATNLIRHLCERNIEARISHRIMADATKNS